MGYAADLSIAEHSAAITSRQGSVDGEIHCISKDIKINADKTGVHGMLKDR
jgi:hypothetical protein